MIHSYIPKTFLVHTYFHALSSLTSTSLISLHICIDPLHQYILCTMLYRNLEGNNEIPDPSTSTKLLHDAAELYSPEFCHSNSRIRAFLYVSRLASDDSLRVHLNETDAKHCALYFESNVLPHWKARAQLLDFCFGEAAKLRKSVKVEEAATAKVDLRIDPYAVQDATERTLNRFAQCAAIENWVANEREVESIVLKHSLDVLNQKCYFHDWLRDFREAYTKM
ncbi:hypothetical protein PUMCH_002301 [Australozyma saopauloensis]|uniref:Uncharacterized protein n=1 Tax=Australozyma saopauloensis TaxID=291208 RepID=A0AAX4HAW5_9ASCO|nr:hypothetical protein PUMCH_002301 [[Candida] saopauloensis]